LYPDFGLLRACRERGVPITLASDAHVPSLVGQDFDEALDLARDAGCETVTVFENRVGRQEPLGQWTTGWAPASTRTLWRRASRSSWGASISRSDAGSQGTRTAT